MADVIVTAERYLEESADRRIDGMRRRAARNGIILPRDIAVDDDVNLPAVVNHGRWIVRCPWCRSAGYAGENCLFMCEECWNGAIGRKYARVYFPSERGKIEELLVKRLSPRNRNWEQGESVAALRRENRAHLPKGGK